MKRRKAYCTAADILYVNKSCLTGKITTSETPAVEALLKGLKTKIDFDKLETGFDFEKFSFLEIVNVLQLFCANVLSLKDYGSCDLEKYIDGDKVTTAHLGMGVSETWRGVPDGRVRGFSINSEIPLLILVENQVVLVQMGLQRLVRLN